MFVGNGVGGHYNQETPSPRKQCMIPIVVDLVYYGFRRNAWRDRFSITHNLLALVSLKQQQKMVSICVRISWYWIMWHIRTIYSKNSIMEYFCADDRNFYYINNPDFGILFEHIFLKMCSFSLKTWHFLMILGYNFIINPVY